MLSPEEAARTLIADCQPAQSQSYIDLQLILSAFEGVILKYASIEGDGELRTRDGRHEIVLSNRARGAGGAFRRRFTLAHEIGHLWLDTRSRAPRQAQAEEERFCNQFAAALLMPRESFQRSARSLARDNLGSLDRLSRQYRTSYAATLIRLHRVMGWRTSLLVWSLTQRWRLENATCVPAGVRYRIRPTERTNEVLTTLGSKGRGTAQLPLVISGLERTYPAQLIAYRHRTLALANLHVR